MYERFTDRALQALTNAKVEARNARQAYLATEHLLLALFRERGSITAQVFEQLHVKESDARAEVARLIAPGAEVITGARPPQTPLFKRVLAFALEEAAHLGHNYVGGEHLLLGILREVDCVAAQVLAHLGVNLDTTRETIVGLLSEVKPDFITGPENQTAPPPECPPGRHTNQFEIHLTAAAADELLEPFYDRLVQRFGRVYRFRVPMAGVYNHDTKWTSEPRQWWFFADDQEAAAAFLREFRQEMQQALGLDEITILSRRVVVF